MRSTGRSWPGNLGWATKPGLLVLRPGAVITEWRVTLGNHLAEALCLEALNPLVGLLRVAGDAVEEGPEKRMTSLP
jgi:hypothetical protein